MLSNNQVQYVQYVEDALIKEVKHNKTSLEKVAASYGILDQNHVKELTELAIVLRARFLAHQPNLTVKQKFDSIVNLYNKQVNLSHRTSQSMLLQQYSTPAPIAYLMGVFCGIDANGSYFEPSAGNGLLTIAGSTSNFTINEIEDFRNENLKSQSYKQVTKMDGSEPLPYPKHFDAVLTNPPFGRLQKKLKIKSPTGSYEIADLDHAMAIHALNTLKDNGKAAIIIGGHTTWDSKGRIQSGKNRIFFSYLYSHYNVVDVILIDGHKLYSRQGTAFNTRLILIDGRKSTPNGFAPLKTKETAMQVDDFNWLYNIITDHLQNDTTILELEAEALEIELELMNF
jgi:tRNA1(Val) A37 N6-methylase TrmN6